jgi:hydrogenase maturation protein HypF
MKKRLKISVKGAVQGVGFRPFIYKLANLLGIKGYVSNTPQGVIIEVQGGEEILKDFVSRIKKDKPPISLIQKITIEELPVCDFQDFEIRKSENEGQPDAIALPDIALCGDCLEELFNPKNRRYLYPFINCTNCGPRFSIIESLPYDRANTTMKSFNMCPDCLAEYENPNDRRFHAQPNACPVCGPRVELWDEIGNVITSGNDAVNETINAIRNGKITALKGLGGFHLIVDALNDEAILKLRKAKHRVEKPFALMYPDISSVKADCIVSDIEEELLTSVRSPIVILRKKHNCKISPYAAERNQNLGVMLPYTPLHHIIMKDLNFPVIATSGNLSEEPICTDEKDALVRLRGIADYFLVHNRPIYRHVDDSIARIYAGDKVILRRARGYAPMPVIISSNSNRHILAVGGHLKNTIAVSKGDEVFISQHIGDLETKESFSSFTKTIDKFKEMYRITPDVVVCDMHPDYISTKYAKENYGNVIQVQHHLAHTLSVIAEHDISESVLGLSWDGAGYGTDGTIWGGEFLKVSRDGFQRFAHLKGFRLAGGESAFRDIFKSAFGILYEIYGNDSVRMAQEILNLPEKEAEIFFRMVLQKINSPLCTSAGRFIDAVASILNVRQNVNYEDQAAMELEFLIDGIESNESYDFEITDNGNNTYTADWTMPVKEIISDKQKQVPGSVISVKFHNTLVSIILAIADLSGEKNIALSGGCFQNKYLLENTVRILLRKKYNVYWNKYVPANDGGISTGQIAYCSYFKQK